MNVFRMRYLQQRKKLCIVVVVFSLSWLRDDLSSHYIGPTTFTFPDARASFSDMGRTAVPHTCSERDLLITPGA